MWKNYGLDCCPLCYKKWIKPILHIFINCNQLKDSNLNENDKTILKFEKITSMIYEIVENNWDKLMKLSI